jgi:hypothetical protein
MNKTDAGKLKIMETTIWSWVSTGTHPSLVIAALNNAFMHGSPMDNGEFAYSQETLKELFKGINICYDACKKVKKEKFLK